MRLLIDANLPRFLTKIVIHHSYEASHVSDVTASDADDRSLWKYAETTGTIIITRDQDFASLRQEARTGPSVVWFRCGNLRLADLLALFDELFPFAVQALERGEVLVELTPPSDDGILRFQR